MTFLTMVSFTMHTSPELRLHWSAEKTMVTKHTLLHYRAVWHDAQFGKKNLRCLKERQSLQRRGMHLTRPTAVFGEKRI